MDREDITQLRSPSGTDSDDSTSEQITRGSIRDIKISLYTTLLLRYLYDNSILLVVFNIFIVYCLDFIQVLNDTRFSGVLSRRHSIADREAEDQDANNNDDDDDGVQISKILIIKVLRILQIVVILNIIYCIGFHYYVYNDIIRDTNNSIHLNHSLFVFLIDEFTNNNNRYSNSNSNQKNGNDSSDDKISVEINKLIKYKCTNLLIIFDVIILLLPLILLSVILGNDTREIREADEGETNFDNNDNNEEGDIGADENITLLNRIKDSIKYKYGLLTIFRYNLLSLSFNKHASTSSSSRVSETSDQNTNRTITESSNINTTPRIAVMPPPSVIQSQYGTI